VLVLAVIVGIGTGLFAEFRTPPGAEPSIDHALTIMLAALAMLGLGIFGPGIATGLVSGAPQLGAGAAAGTALGAAGLAVAGGAAVASAGSAVAAGARMAPGAARAAIGSGAAAARSASGLAGGAKSAYQHSAAASGSGGVRAASAGLAYLTKTGAGAAGQRIASGARAVKDRVSNFVADAAAPATAGNAASAGVDEAPVHLPPSRHGPGRCAASSS
jgi:type IV secretion system protein TrbL